MVCVSKIALIIITIITLIIILVQYCIFVKMCADAYLKGQNECQKNTHSVVKPIDIVEQPQIVRQIVPQIVPPTIIQPPPPTFPLTDPVKTYDYQKLADPLEEPTKRVDRYLLGPIEYRRMFNYPVRGYPDNPRWLGLLICEEDDHSNKILKLFGRQKYPRSSHYEYYTMINMGFDQIKVHIKRRQELYDDDEVHVPEINKKYKVKLNKDDDNSYNPYF